MNTGWLDNGFLLLLGAAGVWFVLRFVLGPRRGAPSLGSFFRREPAPQLEGLGQKAIATLIADMKSFVIDEAALRGLLLAGPFAARAANASSAAVFIALCEAPESYAEADWLLRWAYPARGHKVTAQATTHEPGHVVHRLALRGAPPVEIHFVTSDRAAAPEGLVQAIAGGFAVLEDPAGQAERLRRRWESLLRATTAPNSEHKREEIP